MKILFFDLETTGLKPEKNGIHQISGIIEIDSETKETFNFKVQPNSKSIIEPEALKVANVTIEQIMAYTPMLEIHKQFTDLLGKYCDKFDKNDKFYLCGYNNASFDNNFLRGFFLQNGDNYFGSWFWNNSIDVMVLATYFLMPKRHEMLDFRLKTVAKTLEIEVEESKLHDAFYDIQLTKQIYDKIQKITIL
jgi:DNA polymerase III subunit epsilon